jgi:hypothetical protein
MKQSPRSEADKIGSVVASPASVAKVSRRVARSLRLARRFCLRCHLPYESHDQKQNDRSYGGGNNCANNSSAKREPQTKAREERASDQRAHNADDNIAYQAVARPSHQLAGEPASYSTNGQGYKQSSGSHDFPPTIRV